MAVPTSVNAGEQDVEKGVNKWRSRLGALIGDWKDIRSTIADLIDQLETLPETVYTERKRADLRERLETLRKRREGIVNNVQSIVSARPKLRDDAIEFGFREDLLSGGGSSGGGNAGTPSGTNAGEAKVGGTPTSDAGGGGGGGKLAGSTGSGAGGKGGGGGGGVNTRERLKNFKLVRLPSGRVVAIRNMNIRGNKVHWGVHVDKADFDKYGVNEKNISSITKAQAKKIEVLGNASELVFRGDDKSEFKAIIRGITRAHKGSPILEDDEVLGIIVAQSALGLNDNETQGLLKKTKWYKRSTDHEQVWTLDYSPEKRREDIRNMKVRLIDELEDLYGMDWQKHIKNPMKQVGKWAEQIASGELGGDPSAGLDRWLRNQFDNAAEIEGTPAWMQQQQEAEDIAKRANRPEEMFERLRTEAMGYLGYDKNNTPRLDRDTLQQWAGQLVTGEKSEGDWAQFLRNQMKTLHPYFDPNLSFTEQASAYKSIAERTLGDTLDWNDRLLRDFTRTKPDGTPTDRPMSLHDFELKVRGDNRAWKQGTALWEEGLGIVQALGNTLKGIG